MSVSRLVKAIGAPGELERSCVKNRLTSLTHSAPCVLICQVLILTAGDGDGDHTYRTEDYGHDEDGAQLPHQDRMVYITSPVRGGIFGSLKTSQIQGFLKIQK